MIKRILAVVFLLLGTNVFTYALARYWTTDTILDEVQSLVRQFLEEKNLIYGERNAQDHIPEEAYQESKALLGVISATGGMYHWYSDSLRYYGLGALLIAVGLLLPFVKQRPSLHSRPTLE